jgi:glycosyltransferase involved in cell wall biosynthesis
MTVPKAASPDARASAARPLTVAWFSFFPVEWLSDVPDYVWKMPRGHPATWQQVLLAELEDNPAFKLHVLVLRKQFERDYHFERRGVNFHLLKTRGGLRAPTFFWLDTWLIRRVLRRLEPDLVHAWGTENGAALVASRLDCPSLVTMQGLIGWYASIVPASRYERLSAFLERVSLKRTSIVTAESSFAVQYLRAHFPRLEIYQVEHAPSAVFHQVQRRPTTSPIRFVFAGTLTYRKGLDLLLRALDQIKGEVPFELLLVSVGPDSYLRALQPGISPELRSRISFKSDLASEEVANGFATATMMICPTRADNSPNSVKEAVVAGLPVVASAVGGIPDYVFHGENGLLFPANDVAACARAIKAAVRHPLFSQGRVAPATLEKVRAYLSPTRMGERFAELYQEVTHCAGANARGTRESTNKIC